MKKQFAAMAAAVMVTMTSVISVSAATNVSSASPDAKEIKYSVTEAENFASEIFLKRKAASELRDYDSTVEDLTIEEMSVERRDDFRDVLKTAILYNGRVNVVASDVALYTTDITGSSKGTVTFAFDEEYAGGTVYFSHFTDNVWEISTEKIDEDGLVSYSFNSFSPFAVLVSSQSYRTSVHVDTTVDARGRKIRAGESVAYAEDTRKASPEKDASGEANATAESDAVGVSPRTGDRDLVRYLLLAGAAAGMLLIVGRGRE